MGDTGPCGPCSEIFYDMGPEASEEGHPDCKFPCDCGRYVEIWNLVFMQFNRYCEFEGFSEGNEDVTYELRGVPTPGPEHKHGPECLRARPLPKPSVDTGMGLERTAAVLQGVVSNYDTDLFVPLMKRASELVGEKPISDSETRLVKLGNYMMPQTGGVLQPSYRVIADHSRAATFLISDGVVPSNEGRGYVLRKIIRRALLHVRFIGGDFPFLSRVAETVIENMKRAYPEILEHAEVVERVLEDEERRFTRTLETGVKRIYQVVADYIRSLLEQSQGAPRDESARLGYGEKRDNKDKEMAEQLGGSGQQLYEALRYLISRLQEIPGAWRMLPGEKVFPLYDTYGLQRDLIEDIMHDLRATVNWTGFDQAMEEQRTRARASWKGGSKEAANPAFAKIAETFKTEKDFYHGTTAKDCRIEAILGKSGPVNELKAGESGEVVLDRTVIYAESGGQMADTGGFYDNANSQLLAEVTGAYYPVAGLVAHKVIAKETLRVGDRVCVDVDTERHARIIRNHTGTHLVHAALRNILGTHVKQAGSLNSPERLRFDFSHFAHVDAEELKDIEQQVNDEIRHNTEIGTEVTSLDNALATGALAFFGDKYPEANVRVVTIPDERSPRGFYSKELCGGTHVHRIGDIGVLKIVSEGSVAAGVRRIEAVTGIGALEHYEQQAQILAQVASRLNTSEDSVLATVEKMSNTVKQLEKELEGQKRKGALGQLDQLASQVQTIKGIKLIASEVQGVDKETLRQLVDSLRQKIGSGVVVLSTADDGKVALIAGVTKDLTAKVHAGKLIQALAKLVGGSGGGRPDLAEAGGKDTSALKSALGTIPALLEPLL